MDIVDDIDEPDEKDICDLCRFYPCQCDAMYDSYKDMMMEMREYRDSGL